MEYALFVEFIKPLTIPLIVPGVTGGAGFTLIAIVSVALVPHALLALTPTLPMYPVVAPKLILIEVVPKPELTGRTIGGTVQL
jgi:hypothetical protein